MVNTASQYKVENDQWLGNELSGCKFKDKRLEKRFRILCEKLSSSVGQPIPFACQDWANTKAAYRFLSNDNVKEAQIMAGHFQATKKRCLESQGQILVLQDTTEISYYSDNIAGLGSIKVMINDNQLYSQKIMNTDSHQHKKVFTVPCEGAR